MTQQDGSITPPGLMPLTVHESRLPGSLTRALSEALREGRLPGDALYATASQARRWLAYHQAWSPSRADESVGAMYREAFARAALPLAERREDGFLVVGVGAGGGRKDADLLEALQRGAATPGGAAIYVPLDASVELALEATEHVSRRLRDALPSLAPHPLVMDLARPEGWAMLPGWLDGLSGLNAADGDPSTLPRIISCLGLLPNLERHALPRRLRTLLREGDRLLLSTNLSPVGFEEDHRRILPQYDNPEARAWYGGALEELGFPAGSFTLNIAARPLDDPPPHAGGDGMDSWVIEVHADLTLDAALTVGEEVLSFARGDRLAVFHSQRFTVEAVERLLAGAGLAVHERWVGGAGEEGLFLCGPG